MRSVHFWLDCRGDPVERWNLISGDLVAFLDRVGFWTWVGDNRGGGEGGDELIKYFKMYNVVTGDWSNVDS